MTGRACALKCLGYIQELHDIYDLILSGAIPDDKLDDFVDAYIDMNEKNLKRKDRFVERYLKPIQDAE